MNKYIKNSPLKCSIIAILVLHSVSCNKRLDKNPHDQIYNSSFWHTIDDADLALAGVYSTLLCETFSYNQTMLDMIGGDAYTASEQTYLLIARGQTQPTTGGIVNNVYYDCYRGIAACNFFMENIDRVSAADTEKNQYKGEVSFLRALYYFTLSNFYGGVPLYTKTVSIDEATVKQSSKAEVLAQVNADLEFAIANLPNTAYAGHAVKGSALALKARVLLYSQQWQEAADAANQVIQDGVFGLNNDYRSMFLASGQTNNPEIMFSAQYLNPDRYSNQDIIISWFGVLNPNDSFVNDFECIDGKPITSSPLYDPADWTKNRDPRLMHTVRVFGEPQINSSGKENYFYEINPSATGWEPMKGVNIDALPMDYSTKSEQDWILLRYADVLLMYAEAKNEVSGPDASVYDAINIVRARPGVDMPPISTGLTKDEMRIRIMHERRVELGLEGLRYADIKRWKTIETYIPSLVDPEGVPRVFNPAKDYLLPFPQSEIDVNPNLEQNSPY